MPQISAKKGTLVIINLQKTPLTSQAAFQIYAECDLAMNMLMERLGIGIPPFELERRIVIGAPLDDEAAENGLLSHWQWRCCEDAEHVEPLPTVLKQERIVLENEELRCLSIKYRRGRE